MCAFFPAKGTREGCPYILGILGTREGCPCILGILGSLGTREGCPCILGILGILGTREGCPYILGILGTREGCPYICCSLSLRTRRRIFPEGLRGMASINAISRTFLYVASLPLAQVIRSSADTFS